MNRPIKVLYLQHHGTASGASHSLRLLIQNFPPGTVEPLVACPAGTALERFHALGIPTRQIRGVSVLMSSVGLPLRGLRTLELLEVFRLAVCSREIRQLVREFRPDLVHLNERGMLHAAWLCKRMGARVIMHARNVADPDTRWALRLAQLCMRRYVDQVIAIDESVRRSLGAERSVTVYNPLPKSAIPDQSSHPDCPPVRITFLSILREYKGLWDLLEAATLLRARNDLVIQIAGGNSRPRDFHQSLFGKCCHALGFAPDVETQLAREIDRRQLSNVRYLGRVDDVSGLCATTHIHVFPSHLNGPGRAVFEMGVHGIPSIVAMRDRVEDVIVDGENGLIVPEKQPRALADAIARLADDEPLRRRLGEAARRQFRTQFDAERSAMRVLQVYREVLEVSPVLSSPGVAVATPA